MVSRKSKGLLEQVAGWNEVGLVLVPTVIVKKAINVIAVIAVNVAASSTLLLFEVFI